MRRSLALLSVAALGLSGLATSWTAPASAAPADQANSRAAEAVPDELVVGYVAGASTGERSRARSRAAATLAEQVVAAGSDRNEVERVTLPTGADRGQAIAALRSDPAVAYAEPNWIYTVDGQPSGQGNPNKGGGSTTVTKTYLTTATYTGTDPYFTDGSLWGMYGSGTRTINDFGANAAAAWADGATGSAQIVVGVIDEGIKFDHADLLGQVRNPAEADGVTGVDDDRNGKLDDIYGWDFVNNDNSVYDGGSTGSSDNHGTHVTGTIGAKADLVGVVGVNHSITVISAKFLGPNGGSLANAVKAVDYLTDLKVNRGLNLVATNNSWGGGGYSTALYDAIRRANGAGILFVAAAGNSGTNNDRRASYPSNYDLPNVIAVAAIDSKGALASFSQYGANTVDLGAPGVGIRSTTANNGGYSTYNGTSMATPHVTGAAALYAAAYPNASATAIKTAILGSAVPTSSLAGKTVTGGRLDIGGALAPTANP